jgi:hypothetical protein
MGTRTGGIVAALALVALVVACNNAQPPAPTPIVPPVLDHTLQLGINGAVGVLSGLGCAKLSASEQATARQVLTALQPVIATNAADAYNQMVTKLASAPGVNYIWAALHKVLDFLAGIAGAQWEGHAQGALGSAVSGCLAGMPAA